MTSPIAPTVRSTVTGPLGVMHLPRKAHALNNLDDFIGAGRMGGGHDAPDHA